MSETKLSPEIRINGFKEAWKAYELNDLCSLITKQTGFDYSATIKPSLLRDGNENTYSFIQNKDFFGTKINLNTDFYIPKKIAEKFPNILLDRPSILISISGKIGNAGLYTLPQKAFIGGAVGICKLTDETNGLVTLYNLLGGAGQRYFQTLIKASSHSNITVEDIRKIKIYLPSSNEEKNRIGTYFSGIDELISLNKAKLEKLSNLKKAMLEKMFPKQGADVPEIRFKGFAGAWEEFRAIELCSISTGKNNTQDKVVDGKYPFFVRSSIVERSNQYLFDEEAVLTVGDGVGTGKVYHYVHGKYDLHQRVYRMFDFKGVLGKYFYHYFSNNFYDRVMSMTAKTSVDSVRFEMIANMLIKHPSIEEQSEIASYLDNLDNLIKLKQIQLEKLNNLKKACLEKMFV